MPWKETGSIWVIFKIKPDYYWASCKMNTADYPDVRRYLERHGIPSKALSPYKPGSSRAWTFHRAFAQVEDAIEAIQLARELHPELPLMAVRRRNIETVWFEDEFPDMPSPTHNPQEEHMDADIQQPLSIKRETLVKTLQARLDEEAATRQKAEDERAANRARVTAAIKSFSDDELVTLVTNYLGLTTAVDVEQWVEKSKETGMYKSKESKPTATENSIAKYVRVLKLASNDTIEVTPQDPVYPLL